MKAKRTMDEPIQTRTSKDRMVKDWWQPAMRMRFLNLMMKIQAPMTSNGRRSQKRPLNSNWTSMSLPTKANSQL